MQCTVYKSLRQFDYFLYVRSDEQFERVPAGLKELLGDLRKVIELELHAERKLAQADVAVAQAGAGADRRVFLVDADIGTGLFHLRICLGRISSFAMPFWL